jgi:hypothetical protein
LQSFVALGEIFADSGGNEIRREKGVVFADLNRAQTRINTGDNAYSGGMGRRQHVILILMKIKDLPGIGSQEKRDSGDGARILQNCSLLTSFLPWLPPIISVKQPALPALEEVMENFAELMQRLLEIQSGGRQRSPELIEEDARLMDRLKRTLTRKPRQTVRRSQDTRVDAIQGPTSPP